MRIASLLLMLFLAGCASTVPRPLEPVMLTGDYIQLDGQLKQKVAALQQHFTSSNDPSLRDVNEYINSFEYQGEDDDTWKSPVQFYADGGGDCEDFAIAKYYALQNAYDVGILVMRRPFSAAHAVLLVNRQWILDNQTDDIVTYAEIARKWEPVYVANQSGIRLIINQ